MNKTKMNNLFASLVIVLTVFAGQAIAGTNSSASSQKKRSLPQKADAVIQKVTGYAKKKELSKLRALMVKEFTWSFGGDNDADQAIDEWRQNPKYLKALVQVLKQGCDVAAPDRIECLGNGNDDFRAGFVNTSDGWRMEYFVAGD